MPSLKDMSNSVEWNYLAQRVIYVCMGPKNISLIADLETEGAQSLPPNSPAPLGAYIAHPSSGSV